jgi:hypothetical protein
MPDTFTASLPDVPPYRMRDLEDGFGIDPLDELHETLDKLVDEQSTLQAKKDNWDGRRKERRMAITALIINELKAQSIAVPTSEAALERIACADPRYTKTLDDAESDFARLAVLNNEIQKLRDRVARGNALARNRATGG